MLLGSAVLGAVTSGTFPTMLAAMNAMNAAGRVVEPQRGEVTQFHERKYRVFHRLHRDALAYRRIMEPAQQREI